MAPDYAAKDTERYPWLPPGLTKALDLRGNCERGHDRRS
jgi:hypothetical protein